MWHICDCYMSKAFANGTDFSKNLKAFGQSPQSLSIFKAFALWANTAWPSGSVVKVLLPGPRFESWPGQLFLHMFPGPVLVTWLWVPAIPAKATCHILYSNSLKWKLNVISNWPNFGDPDFELNIKFCASVEREDMLNFCVPRGSWKQNFDFFSFNNFIANLPMETGYKII